MYWRDWLATFLNTFYNIIKLGTNKQKGSKIYDFAAFRKEKYKKITPLMPPFPDDKGIQLLGVNRVLLFYQSQKEKGGGGNSAPHLSPNQLIN